MAGDPVLDAVGIVLLDVLKQLKPRRGYRNGEVKVELLRELGQITSYSL